MIVKEPCRQEAACLWEPRRRLGTLAAQEPGTPQCPALSRQPRRVMSEYGTLLQDLTNNITLEDLEQFKLACKEDVPTEKSKAITTDSERLVQLPGDHKKIDKDSLSYTEHIFEISYHPDLLTMVVSYRTRLPEISEKELDTKLTCTTCAQMYIDIIQQPCEDEIINLAPPPKKA